jgi:hypothetical protein
MLYRDWTSHIENEQDKKDFSNDVYRASRVLSRLSAMLNLREAAVEKSELTVKDFEDPNWAYKQAFRNGVRSGLSIAKNYIDLDKQKEQNT